MADDSSEIVKEVVEGGTATNAKVLMDGPAFRPVGQVSTKQSLAKSQSRLLPHPRLKVALIWLT